MRLCAALVAAALVALPAVARAADVTLILTDSGFSPDKATMKPGDRLVVINKSGTRQFVWGQGMSGKATTYAFDYRATRENNWTHEPGQSLGIPLNIPGRYRIGMIGPQQAVVTVEP